MEHVREKYDFVFNKDKFSLDDYNDSINFGDLPASSPPPSGKIIYFIFKRAARPFAVQQELLKVQYSRKNIGIIYIAQKMCCVLS